MWLPFAFDKDIPRLGLDKSWIGNWGGFDGDAKPKFEASVCGDCIV